MITLIFRFVSRLIALIKELLDPAYGGSPYDA